MEMGKQWIIKLVGVVLSDPHTELTSGGVCVSAGCDRLHLLLQDPHERPGHARTARQPVAHRQQHHGLPPPAHPLGPLLPAGPAGAAPSPAPPAQPPQRAAPAGPQVVHPENERERPAYPFLPHLLNTVPPSSSLQLYTGPCTVHVKLGHHLTASNPKRSEVFAPGVAPFYVFAHCIFFSFLPLKRLDTKCWAWDEVFPNVCFVFFVFVFFD